MMKPKEEVKVCQIEFELEFSGIERLSSIMTMPQTSFWKLKGRSEFKCRLVLCKLCTIELTMKKSSIYIHLNATSKLSSHFRTSCYIPQLLLIKAYLLYNMLLFEKPLNAE